MQRHFLLTLVLVLMCAFVSAQKQGNIWYFGYNAGISFNAGAPVALTNGALNQSEGCASIADGNGNLLFYTDGYQIYNRNHIVMPNGSGLKGQSISAQSAIVVPLPQSQTQYYVFTIGDWFNTNAGLNYSIVDMSLNNGLGDVTVKNSLLILNANEQVTAVHHRNCQDVWIVTHEKGNNNRYQAFLLTAAGVNTTPVTSATGMNYNGGNRYGYLKASHDGKKLCSTLGYASNPVSIPTVELSDFDNATGQVSNTITLAIHSVIGDAYASEFSPDDSKLYVVAYNGSFIYQYDITLGTPAAIVGSRINIASGTSIKSCVQLGPDKKIYVSRNGGYLGVINNPNSAGTLSNYVDDGVYLAGRNASLGLPNFNALYFSYPNLGPDTLLCQGATLLLDVSGLGSTSYLWQNNDVLPTYTVNQPGLYWVEVTSSTGCLKRDSLNVVYSTLQVALGNDTIICSGKSVLLDAAPAAGDSYVWQSGATGATYPASLAGKYWVDVFKRGCKATDTILVTTGADPVLDLGRDSILCENATLALNVFDAGSTAYAWQNGSVLPAFTINQAGQYWVDVTSTSGCHKKDTINVSYAHIPVVLGNDTTLCNGTNLLLDVASAAGDSYVWQNGTTSVNYPVSLAGKYWVDVFKSGCKATDTIVVAYAAVPNVTLGNDTTVCNKATLLLNAAVGGSIQYTWQDGSAGNTYTVSQPGQYWVHASNSGCIHSDTILVAYARPPVVDLGRDTSLCEGNFLLLNATVNIPATWQWQDGAVDPVYRAVKTGKYRVNITTACEVIADSVLVKFEDCNCQVKVPNAFTPDGNGRNDHFKPAMEADCRFTEYRLTIFNRWGERVFDSNNPAIGWNGLYKSQKADVGGYAYILLYRTPANTITEKRTGMVMLLR
jgi:gliding motility-associated-like protein